MKLSKRNSGYSLGRSDWISFLSCWKEAAKAVPDYPEGSLIRFSDEASKSQLPFLLNRPGITLPRSFVDFYEAYAEMGGVYRDPQYEEGIGICSPSEIQPLSQFSETLLAISNESPGDASDDRYYLYGVDQDDAAVRTRYQDNAIVVGQYGFSFYELIVLYPDSLTEDGEMEVALFAPASECRTPSFAEMMRQLSYFFTRYPDSIPPYSQEQLKGTCADRLPLRTWWR